MRRFLIDLGVPDAAILSEDRSNNTIENISNVRDMVNDRPVALVTSAYHMARAMQIATTAKLHASAFPTGFQVSYTAPWEYWLPSMGGLEQFLGAMHENLAIAFDYRVKTLAN